MGVMAEFKKGIFTVAASSLCVRSRQVNCLKSASEREKKSPRRPSHSGALPFIQRSHEEGESGLRGRGK